MHACTLRKGLTDCIHNGKYRGQLRTENYNYARVYLQVFPLYIQTHAVLGGQAEGVNQVEDVGLDYTQKK